MDNKVCASRRISGVGWTPEDKLLQLFGDEVLTEHKVKILLTE